MMPPPRLLDWYCCEGGASVGFHRAGFTVYGLDTFEEYSRARYPFKSVRMDALEAFNVLLSGGSLTFTDAKGQAPETLSLADFAAWAGSPPCQHASAGTRALRAHGRKAYPQLVEPTRYYFRESGLPYVLENVRGAALVDPLELCGCMFDLQATDTDGIRLYLQRPRRFESNVDLAEPRPCDHSAHDWVGGVYGGARRDKYEAKYVRRGGYVPPDKRVAQTLLGIEWMTWAGMYQAIPPAYTRHLGRQLLDALEADRGAVA